MPLSQLVPYPGLPWCCMGLHKSPLTALPNPLSMCTPNLTFFQEEVIHITNSLKKGTSRLAMVAKATQADYNHKAKPNTPSLHSSGIAARHKHRLGAAWQKGSIMTSCQAPDQLIFIKLSHVYRLI